jgi:hypothetical protein
MGRYKSGAIVHDFCLMSQVSGQTDTAYIPVRIRYAKTSRINVLRKRVKANEVISESHHHAESIQESGVETS